MAWQYDFRDLPGYMEKLKKNMHIAVVHGGDKEQPGATLYKTHNPRAWKSYARVAGDIKNTLQDLGFRNVQVLPDDLTLLANLEKHRIHLVWLNTGGVQGYIPTAHAASMLEMAGVPYIGHNPMNAAVLDNKHIFKFMLQKFGIPTSPFVAWSRSGLVQDRRADLRQLEQVFGDYPGPFLVKPTSGRASLHIHIADNYRELFEKIELVHSITRNLVVVEKYLPGREYCVSVCGPVICKQASFSLAEQPFAFTVLERVLDKEERIFTSMDKKPITEKRIRLCCRTREAELMDRLKTIARQIYTRFFLETLVRVDIRADNRGNLNVLEANPKPDLKKPAGGVINLTCSGLPGLDMEYHDLIYSLLSDRLDYLLRYHPGNISHIIQFLQ